MTSAGTQFLHRHRRLPPRHGLWLQVTTTTGVGVGLRHGRRFATSASSGSLARAIYRNLLDWCRRMDPSAPLVHIPPLHLEAPAHIDPYRTEVLAEYQRGRPPCAPSLLSPEIAYARKRLPPNTVFGPKNMTIPIRNVNQLRGLIQSIFRINVDLPQDPAIQKERVTLAFNALRSLNKLAEAMFQQDQEREAHSDRTGIQYRVGQVVRHQYERWRGVITGWKRLGDGTIKGTSVTTKEYVPGVISYSVLVDVGDASKIGWAESRQDALQSDIEPVSDAGLLRIRNPEILGHFDRFDSFSGTFVPTDVTAYKYPLDFDASLTTPVMSQDVEQLCSSIIHGVQGLAEKLQRIILDESSCPKERGFLLLDDIEIRLRRLREGDVVPRSIQLSSIVMRPLTLACLHIRALFLLTFEILDLYRKRRIARMHSSRVTFRIGEIVQHTMYQYRGVIVGWDPRPTVDVSRWDGVQHLIEEGVNVSEVPFYQVIADPDDCIRVFGAERGLRYVCEGNLKPCPADQTNVNIDFEDAAWTRHDDGSGEIRYSAPSHLLFIHNQDDPLHDDSVTERCIEAVVQAINEWQYHACNNTIPLNATAYALTMENLIKLLQACDTPNDAMAIQECIKEMRKAHPQIDSRCTLEQGIADLLAGKGEEALECFRNLVEEDPLYIEAWNKRGTCEYMLGRDDDSIASTRRTLELAPDHFNAYSGLGLVYMKRSDFSQAVDCFRNSVRLDPWSPAATELSYATDLLIKKVWKEETP